MVLPVGRVDLDPRGSLYSGAAQRLEAGFEAVEVDLKIRKIRILKYDI